MSNEKQFGVLHEIGDYYQPKKLSDDDNHRINEQLNNTDDDKDKYPKKYGNE